MSLFDLLFPKNCLECGEAGKYICKNCVKKVPFSGSNSIWEYKGVIRKAIIALKYKFVTEIADELIDHINLPPSNQTLIPIPSHWYKQNHRGFNQAELLGEKLANKMGWEFVPNLLIKTKPTLPQVGLKGQVRRQNLTGVFSVRPPYIQYTKYDILLFDDVYTTGSTLKEAREVLQKVGFKKIYILTLAR